MAVQKQWVLYILKCSDSTLYTGVTNDIDARLARHRGGKGAKYTRGRLPVVLVYTEKCHDRAAALRRECAVKKYSRRDKLTLTSHVGRIKKGHVETSAARLGKR